MTFGIIKDFQNFKNGNQSIKFNDFSMNPTLCSTIVATWSWSTFVGNSAATACTVAAVTLAAEYPQRTLKSTSKL